MIRVETKDNETSIYLYGRIGTGYDITDTEFLSVLSGVTSQVLNIRINSPGGDVFQGNAIYNALKSYNGTVNTYIDGVAASFASVIALAGLKIFMANNAMFMIHNASTSAQGDSRDFMKAATLLDKINATMIEVYKARTNMTDEQLIELLNNETWYTATEAKEAGFIDEISDSVLKSEIAATYKPKAQGQVYGLEDVCTALGLPIKTPITEVLDFLTLQSTQLNKLRLAIGMPATATLEQVVDSFEKERTEFVKILSALKLSATAKTAEILEAIKKLNGIIDGDEATDDTIEETVQAYASIKTISVDLIPYYKRLLKADYRGTKALLETMPKPAKLSAMLNRGVADENGIKPRALWNLDDYRKHDPQALRKDPSLYERLYKEHYQ